MNLKGIAIGNGWTDPYDQYPGYATFSRENKLVSEHHYYLLEGLYKICQVLIEEGHTLIAQVVCEITTQTIHGNPFGTPTFNVFDIRKAC